MEAMQPALASSPAHYPASVSADARRRLEAFWAGSSLGGRPALHITWKDATLSAEPWTGSSDPLVRDRDPAFQAHMARMSLRERCLAEAVPRTGIHFGSNIALLPALLGHPYGYTSGTAWIHPVEDIYDLPIPAFDPTHPLIRDLEEGMRQAAAVIGDQAALVPPALGLDALTALSLLRGAETMCEDLVDDPERVEAWLVPVRAFWRDLARHLTATTRSLGHAGGASWLHTWAPGSFEALQCDAAVLLSKPMFKRFVLPELTAAAASFDYALYHLDGTCQMRFLDQIAAVPNIRGIQWNPEPGENRIEDPRWIESFRAIRQRGLLLQFNCWESRTVEQVIAVVRALGPDGLMFALPAFASEGEAVAALERIERECR
jgi:hypothetical protein